MKTKIMILGMLLLAACQGPKGDRGANGGTGQTGSMGPAGIGESGPQGIQGLMGLQGPAGINSTVPFYYDGTYSFPQTSVTQIVPGLDLEHGDVINVYISWQNQPWTQIGSTWVGGMAGSYAVTGNVVTITTVIGPAAPLVMWAINGVKNQ